VREKDMQYICGEMIKDGQFNLDTMIQNYFRNWVDAVLVFLKDYWNFMSVYNYEDERIV
jgi:hypothetical protein